MWGRRHWETHIDLHHAGRISSRAVRAVRAVVEPVTRLLYRPRLEGAAHLPREGPFILVANHSAGLGIAEGLSFAALYLREVGPEHPLATLALPTDFTLPVMKDVMVALGAIPSTTTAALQTLRAGVPVLVFPGGDHEALRPFWQKDRVDFGGRRGFLRLARASGVPIVPMGIHGAHLTAPPLVRAKLLSWIFIVPRLLGAKRWAISLSGLVGALALALAPLDWPLRAALIYLWLSSPMTFWPILPARIRFTIGAPLGVDALFDGGPEEERFALERVERAVQALVDAGR